jgi:predicted HicB family RNase H-like nuclease
MPKQAGSAVLSKRLVVLTTPSLHGRIAAAARRDLTSYNDYVRGAILARLRDDERRDGTTVVATAG